MYGCAVDERGVDRAAGWCGDGCTRDGVAVDRLGGDAAGDEVGGGEGGWEQDGDDVGLCYRCVVCDDDVVKDEGVWVELQVSQFDGRGVVEDVAVHRGFAEFVAVVRGVEVVRREVEREVVVCAVDANDDERDVGVPVGVCGGGGAYEERGGHD